MSRFAVLIAVAFAAAVAWLSLGPLEHAARLWAAALLVLLPALTIVQARAFRSVTELPRVGVYISSILSLAALAAVSLGIAFIAGTSDDTLSLRSASAGATLLWATACTVAGLGVIQAFRLIGVREGTMIRQLMPRSPRERAWYSALSLAAGLCEELVFRGFLLGVLAIAWGSVAAASLASAAVFGVVHGYQGVAGAVRAAVLGVALTVPVLATGSLIPSMAAHFALDMILGLLLADRLLD